MGMIRFSFIAYNYGGINKYTYEMPENESSNDEPSYDMGFAGNAQNV